MKNESRISVRTLTAMALLIAMSIVFSRVLSISTGFVRFNLGSLPVLLAGILFGPWAGFVVGMVADIIGGVLAGYAINPLITLGAASIGLVGGLVAVVIVYVLFVVYLLIRGENAIGRVAEKLVPIMCGAYLLATIVILLMNITYVPTMFAEIFKGAFTGTAAVGGFAGSVVSLTIRQGVARSVYSNEAGNGTSPLIHGSADTIHPVRQGLWGAVEVFCDTLVVCTCSGLAILATGTWSSGVTGAPLGVLAFTTAFGEAGRYFLGIMTVLFAFTTSTTWYLFYQNILTYLLEKWPKAQKAAHKVFTVAFPLIMVGNAALVYYSNSDATLFWTIVSIVTAFPLFFNVLALIALRKKFWALLKDYKARYMGIGQVDPNFHVFAEDDPEVMAKINKNLGRS